MEEMKKDVCTHGDHCCGCNSGKMGVCGRHMASRWLVILVAIGLSFWVGMKLGEIRGYMMATGYPIMQKHWQRDAVRPMPVDQQVQPDTTATQ